MAKLERTYNIPLRKEYMKAPIYKRTNRAVKALRAFLVRHMKADIKNVKIGSYLNEHMWEHSQKNPPHHVKVNVTKDDEGHVFAELVGAPVAVKKETKKGAKTASKKAETKAPAPPKIPDAATIKKIEEEAKLAAEKDKAESAEKKEMAEEAKEEKK